ncbi:MAG: hypothetical protein ACPG31_03055 [Planctomycetota bacterium]
MVITALLLLTPLCLAAPQDPTKVSEFSAQLRAAAEVGDKKGMSKALRKYREDAVLAFMSRAGIRAAGNSSAEMDEWLDLFQEAWEDTYKTDFARNYDRYLQRLSPTMTDIRRDLLNQQYPNINRMHIMAMNKEEVGWTELRKNAINLANAIADTGDLYYTALAKNIVGNVHHPYYHEEGASAQVAYEAYQAVVDAREKLGLTNDQFFSTAENALAECRNILGIEDPNAKEEHSGPKKPNKEAIPAMANVEVAEAVLEVTHDAKPGGVIHASDLADVDHWNWQRGNMPKPGEEMTFSFFDPPVRMTRIDKQKFTLEAGAGETKPFKITPKPEQVTVMRKHADGTDRPFTFEVCTGTQNDIYQGATMNLEPSDTGGPLFVRSVMTQTAKTPFGQFTLYDANSDGMIGNPELKQIWAEGLMEGVFIYRTDAMTLGKMKNSWPFSRYIRDAKGRWFEVALPSNDAPGSVTLTQVQPNLGQIQYSISGVKKLKVASLLLSSNSSQTKGLVVDLAGMKGKVLEIPIGRYQFLQARLIGKDGAEVLVQPDSTLPFFLDVNEDPEDIAKIELGAPFELRAKVEHDGRDLKVDGLSLHLRGKSKEIWFRVIGEPMYGIEVNVTGAKAGELRAPDSEEAATQWERLFYPMDAEFVLKKGSEKPEVTLTLKKHPWFGKISNRIGE